MPDPIIDPEALAKDAAEIVGHTQTILATPDLVEQGVYGNCMQAAIATALRKPLDAVPHFGAFSYWPGALRLWLRGEGLDYTVVKAPPIPQERAMLCGKSPRGYAHAVVSEGGRIIWDPHPSRDGLTTVTGAYLLHEWDTSASATAPSQIDALSTQTPAQYVAGLAEDEALVRRAAYTRDSAFYDDETAEFGRQYLRALAAALAEREGER